MRARTMRKSGGVIPSLRSKEDHHPKVLAAARAGRKGGGCVRDDDRDAMSCGGRLDRKPRKSGGSVGSPNGAPNVSASVSSPLAKK